MARVARSRDDDADSLDIYPKDVREFRIFSAKGKPHRQISTIHATVATQRMLAGPTGEPAGRRVFQHRQRPQPRIARAASMNERQLCDAIPDSESDTPSFHFWRLTAREKLLLLSFAFGDFFIYLCFSVIAPFFPAEVSKKGGTTTMAGMIFAQYALVSCIAAPIFGQVLPHLGARWTLMMGLLVNGAANIIFGFLDEVNDSTLFIVYCFITRSIEAVGAAAYATSSYALLAQQFPDFIVPAFGILEAFVGLGLTVGPAVGGFLYSLGGYKLPFVSLGFILMLSPAVFWFFLPAEPQQLKLPRARYSGLLRSPKALAVSFVITVISGVWSFFDPVLEPHLRPLNLSAEILGLLFLLTAATYTISSPLWGWFGDRVGASESLMIVGLILTAVVMLAFGPSPLLAFFMPKETLWLNIVCLACLGLFVSMAIIPTFDCLLTAALEGAGMEENFATYSLVSGLWSASYSLGEVIGPLVGGLVFDHYGFPMAATIMAGLSLLAALVLIFEAIRRRYALYRRTQRFLKYGPSPLPTADGEVDNDDEDADGSDATGSSDLTIRSHHQFYYNNGWSSRGGEAADVTDRDPEKVETWVVKNLHRDKRRRRRALLRMQTSPHFGAVYDDDDDDADRSTTKTAARNDEKNVNAPILPVINPAAGPATAAMLTRHNSGLHASPSSLASAKQEAKLQQHNRNTLAVEADRNDDRSVSAGSPLLDNFLRDTQNYQLVRSMKRRHSRVRIADASRGVDNFAAASNDAKFGGKPIRRCISLSQLLPTDANAAAASQLLFTHPRRRGYCLQRSAKSVIESKLNKSSSRTMPHKAKLRQQQSQSYQNDPSYWLRRAGATVPNENDEFNEIDDGNYADDAVLIPNAVCSATKSPGSRKLRAVIFATSEEKEAERRCSSRNEVAKTLKPKKVVRGDSKLGDGLRRQRRDSDDSVAESV